jgi:hypothetical protein
MVSPVDKNGGQVDPPGSLAGGGVLEAAAIGGAVTYSSATAFGPDATGAPPASQYMGARSSGGWLTSDLTVPVLSSSYSRVEDGVPYQIFSPDLSRALLLNGDHCRGAGSDCAVPNPPLAGTNAPEGYQDYYLRENGVFTALIETSDVAGRGIDPSNFEVRLAGASPDLRTVVVSTCSPLTADATDGCDTGRQNLYKWSQATGALTLINSSPGAAIAAPAGAVSDDGAKVYWRDPSAGELSVNQSGINTQIDAGGGVFQAASADGAIAYYTKGEHLWRYSGGSSSDLTPAGGVIGVLGTSSSGGDVYFQDSSALKQWSNGTVSTVALGSEAADPSTYPPATGSSRVSAGGSLLLFVSKASLTGYDNTDKVTHLPDSEVFLFNAGQLRCVSCNPFGKTPIGPSTIPGAVPNGSAPGSVQAYKPRVLTANGKRVFFNSGDALVTSDSNTLPASGTGIPDAYEWEARGEGSCAVAGGCIGIISNGSLPNGASFVDASSDGGDAFFLTAASLVPADPGSVDLYDARVGGGFPEPTAPIPCEGDACQVLPPVPAEPTLATQEEGLGNPPIVYHKYCRQGYVKRKGICVKKGSRRHHKARRHKPRGRHTHGGGGSER